MADGPETRTAGAPPRRELPRPLREVLLGRWTAALIALIPPLLLVCPAGLYLAAPWTFFGGLLAWFLYLPAFGLAMTCLDLLLLEFGDGDDEDELIQNPNHKDDLYV